MWITPKAWQHYEAIPVKGAYGARQLQNPDGSNGGNRSKHHDDNNNNNNNNNNNRHHNNNQPKGGKKGKGKGKGKQQGKQADKSAKRDTFAEESLVSWIYPAAVKKALLHELGPLRFALHTAGNVDELDVDHEHEIGIGSDPAKAIVASAEVPANHLLWAKDHEGWGHVIDEATYQHYTDDTTPPPHIVFFQGTVPVESRRALLDQLEDRYERGLAAKLADDNVQPDESPEDTDKRLANRWMKLYLTIRIYLLVDHDKHDAPFQVWRHSLKGLAPRDSWTPGAQNGVADAWWKYVEGFRCIPNFPLTKYHPEAPPDTNTHDADGTPRPLSIRCLDSKWVKTITLNTTASIEILTMDSRGDEAKQKKRELNVKDIPIDVYTKKIIKTGKTATGTVELEVDITIDRYPHL